VNVTIPLAAARRTQPRFAALPPLALYVHVPWCVRKCPYCDFNSHEAKGAIEEGRYVEALTRDLEIALPQVWGRKVYSVFFGGGTPSLLSPEAIDAILSAVRARLPLAADAEITLEANPGTAEAAKFRGFRDAGVNRLSLGIQSFDDALLKAIGRIHGADDARRAAELALSTFGNVNLDLMYALPGQTLEQVKRDVATAIDFAPPHLSAYHLTLEPNTYFHRYPPQLPDDDTAAAMQDAVDEALGAAGYANYETAAFAQPGRECRHNLNYWRFGDYLGIGAGAHTKISFPDRVTRAMRYKQPRQYLEQAERGEPVQQEHDVGPADLPGEFMMNALRLREGFALALFEERTGLPITATLPALEEAERRGFIERDHARVAPTALGRRFLNDLLQVFLTAESR
jgi:oxygen-independent coproporphyrinogen-3 oxidase